MVRDLMGLYVRFGVNPSARGAYQRLGFLARAARGGGRGLRHRLDLGPDHWRGGRLLPPESRSPTGRSFSGAIRRPDLVAASRVAQVAAVDLDQAGGARDVALDVFHQAPTGSALPASAAAVSLAAEGQREQVAATTRAPPGGSGGDAAVQSPGMARLPAPGPPGSGWHWGDLVHGPASVVALSDSWVGSPIQGTAAPRARPRCAARARCPASCGRLNSALHALDQRLGIDLGAGAPAEVLDQRRDVLAAARAAAGWSGAGPRAGSTGRRGTALALTASRRSRLVAAMTCTSRLHGLGRAQPADGALLQRAQQLGLQLQRQLADLVEEHRAALGRLEGARCGARRRR